MVKKVPIVRGVAEGRVEDWMIAGTGRMRELVDEMGGPDEVWKERETWGWEWARGLVELVRKGMIGRFYCPWCQGLI